MATRSHLMHATLWNVTPATKTPIDFRHSQNRKEIYWNSKQQMSRSSLLNKLRFWLVILPAFISWFMVRPFFHVSYSSEIFFKKSFSHCNIKGFGYFQLKTSVTYEYKLNFKCWHPTPTARSSDLLQINRISGMKMDRKVRVKGNARYYNNWTKYASAVGTFTRLLDFDRLLRNGIVEKSHKKKTQVSSGEQKCDWKPLFKSELIKLNFSDAFNKTFIGLRVIIKVVVQIDVKQIFLAPVSVSCTLLRFCIKLHYTEFITVPNRMCNTGAPHFFFWKAFTASIINASHISLWVCDKQIRLGVEI